MANNYKPKLLMFGILLIAAAICYGQIPNAGFENWTSGNCVFNSYNNPNSWGTINSLTCITGAFTVSKTTTAGYVHSGTSALKMVTQNVAGQTAPGICATGIINQNTQNVEGGFGLPANYKPIKLRGWYQYAPSGNDTFNISINLYSGATSGTIIGSGSLSGTATVSSYTQFTVDINYTGSGYPDSAQITILNSAGDHGQVGTTMYVDDLWLVDCGGFGVATTPAAASCTQSNGSVVAVASGGAGPYTYQWSNSATTATISNLPAATYTVIATDTNGCSVSASATVATNNIPFTVNASATTSSCVANTGMAWAAASAGNSPYTYLWNNTSTTDTILNLGPGNYRVTVTDAHGCSTTASTSVTTATGPSATDSVVDILCNGGATGSAMVTVSGGTSPIVYNWSNGATTSSITGLTAGNYTVTITDNNSCSFTLTAFISEPPGLLASSTASNLNCYGDSNGSVDVTVSGGTSPYSYTWNNSTTTQNLSNVAAGVYTLVVTDSNNCTISLSDTITQPTALVVTINATDASSASASDGSASADISGGTAPYTIVWNTSSTHDTITHLSADSYCATVTDNAGCTANACDSVGYPTAIVSINNKPVKIYPNPATNNITVEIPQGSILVFSIYNIEGRLVETEKLAGPKTQINVTNLPSGPYLFRIIDVATGSNSSGKIQVIK